MRTNPRFNYILIVGIVKNVQETIQIDIDRLELAFDNFARTEFFVVESNSSDNSIETLKQISASKENFSYETIMDFKDGDLLRTESLAFARNKYLEHLRKIPNEAQPDYVAVVDFDNLNNLLTQQTVNTCWENLDWDVCTANQSGHYYDIWALRHKYWSPNDCWQHFNFLVDLGVRTDKAYSIAINSRMIRLSPNSNWVEVDSAFGGFALYKTSTLMAANYIGKLSTGEPVCEHVPLHKQIRDSGFRIYINPRLINFKYTDHSKNVFARNKLLRFFKHTLLSLFR